MFRYEVICTLEFEDWFNTQSKKSQVQIPDRLDRIEKEGHFGQHKLVVHDLMIWELKWRGGRRIYYAYLQDKMIVLLLGGNKNGQGKDITRAKKIIKSCTEARIES
jgi:putative addiction module killer protein